MCGWRVLEIALLLARRPVRHARLRGAPRGRRSRRRRRAALTPRARRYARFAPTLPPSRRRGRLFRAQGWCDRTRGGVSATPADVADVHRLAHALASASAASPSPTADLVGTSWRLLGCAQATLPAPASWLASPFFWIAKEAQHDPTASPSASRTSSRPSNSPRASPPAIPRRRERSGYAPSADARCPPPFPFGVLESVLNRLEVPFASGAARVAFARAEERNHLRMISRVHVDFADGGLVGELVTACTLEPEETGDAFPSTRRRVALHRRRLPLSSPRVFGDDGVRGHGHASGRRVGSKRGDHACADVAVAAASEDARARGRGAGDDVPARDFRRRRGDGGPRGLMRRDGDSPRLRPGTRESSSVDLVRVRSTTRRRACVLSYAWR